MPGLSIDKFMLTAPGSSPLRTLPAPHGSCAHRPVSASDAAQPNASTLRVMQVTSIGEAKFEAIGGDELVEMQRRSQRSHCRAFPLGLRTDSSNMDPRPAWRAGAAMVALNLQTNDLPTQLHYALFELGGGAGYVLKPPEMCSTDGKWPPDRQTVTRVCLRVLSLHHLPSRGEQRPYRGTGPHAACHSHVPHLTGSSIPPKASAAVVCCPSIQLELYAIGGFCAVSEFKRPKGPQVLPTLHRRPCPRPSLFPLSLPHLPVPPVPLLPPSLSAFLPEA